METRIAELRWKEVIGLRDGSRFGYVEDMEERPGALTGGPRPAASVRPAGP